MIAVKTYAQAIRWIVSEENRNEAVVLRDVAPVVVYRSVQDVLEMNDPESAYDDLATVALVAELFEVNRMIVATDVVRERLDPGSVERAPRLPRVT